MIVGLTGSIGSGKSTVLSLLENCGYPTIDADDIVLELFADPTHFIFQHVVSVVGPGCVDVRHDTDYIDRDLLRDLLTPELRANIDAHITPYIWNKVRAFHEVLGRRTIVFACARLFECGFDTDLKVFVYSKNLKKQIDRAVTRGTPPHIVDKILSTQMDQMTKLDHADFVIENSSTMLALGRQVDELIRCIEES